MNSNDGRPDQEQGLYRKYELTRLNDPKGKHKNCTYFVLDLNHDPHSVAALEAYAESCKEQYPALAFDLRHTAAATARKLGVTPRPEEVRSEWRDALSNQPLWEVPVLAMFADKKMMVLELNMEGWVDAESQDIMYQLPTHWRRLPEGPPSPPVASALNPQAAWPFPEKKA